LCPQEALAQSSVILAGSRKALYEHGVDKADAACVSRVCLGLAFCLLLCDAVWMMRLGGGAKLDACSARLETPH